MQTENGFRSSLNVTVGNFHSTRCLGGKDLLNISDLQRGYYVVWDESERMIVERCYDNVLIISTKQNEI